MSQIKGKVGFYVKKAIDNKAKIVFAGGTILLVGGAILLVSATAAHAVAAPAKGSFAFDVYDIAINKILKGGIGFVAGAGAMVAGAVCAIQQKVMESVPCVLGGAVLLNGDKLVTTLGMIV